MWKNSIRNQNTFVNFGIIRTHTHPFDGPFSRKVKTIWIILKQDSEWQRHQLGHMQVCTSPQTDNHANNPPLSFFYRQDALPATQATASTEGMAYFGIIIHRI